VLNRRLTILAAPALWLEYEDVLKRADIRRLHQLSSAIFTPLACASASVCCNPPNV
jgi:hypothetical protein